MDWTKSFRPERRVSWDDVANTIHASVTMEDAIRMYAPSTQIRNRRCPCPIHLGRDYNFSFTDHAYKCFVCGSSGDVVTFVKEVCELSTRVDAMREIVKDFRLNVDAGDTITHEQDQALRKMREEAERKKREHDAWYERYHALLDEWCALDSKLPDAQSPAEIAGIRQRMAELDYEIYSLPPEPR